jgi:hypothetical protein
MHRRPSPPSSHPNDQVHPQPRQPDHQTRPEHEPGIAPTFGADTTEAKGGVSHSSKVGYVHKGAQNAIISHRSLLKREDIAERKGRRDCEERTFQQSRPLFEQRLLGFERLGEMEGVLTELNGHLRTAIHLVSFFQTLS